MPRMNKKEKIIKAALDLFCEKGFADTDVDSVAKKAGVGKGTVYLYFKDKKDLFISSITFALKFFNTDLEKSVASVEGDREKLKLYIDHSLSVLTNNKNITRLFVTEVLETMRRCQSQSNLFDKSIFLKRFTLLKKILESGMKNNEFKKADKESISVMIMGGIHMIMTKYLVSSAKIDKKELLDYRESVLKLITKE